MPGMTNAESASTLDARFPTTGATDHIAWSINGTSEFAGLARTAVGATGWAAATVADPSVKANAIALTSAAATVATGAGGVTHFAVYSASSGGTQRVDWTALGGTPPQLLVGDTLTVAIGAIALTQT